MQTRIRKFAVCCAITAAAVSGLTACDSEAPSMKSPERVVRGRSDALYGLGRELTVKVVADGVTSVETGTGAANRIQEHLDNLEADPDDPRGLFLGNWYMALASSLRPMYLGTDLQGRRVISEEAPPHVEIVVDPTGSHDVGTLALMAQWFFTGCLTEAADGAAATAAECLSGLIEASELARRSIVAAGEANSLRSTDRGDGWRGTSNSRLAAAASYVTVPSHLYSNNGLTPVYRWESNNSHYYSSSVRDTPPTGFSRAADPAFWLVHPSLHLSFFGDVWESRDFAGRRCTAPNYRDQCRDGHLVRWEGLGGYRDMDSLERLPVEVEPQLRWLTFGQAPVGTTPDIQLSAAEDSSGDASIVFAGPYAPSLEWPVLSGAPPSEAVARAEALIRSHRVNPIGGGAAVTAQVLASIRSRYAVSKTVSDAALLERLRVTSQEFQAAAARVMDEVRAFGLAVVPIPGTNPVKYTVPQEGFRPQVDPAYLYALTEGSSSPRFPFVGEVGGYGEAQDNPSGSSYFGPLHAVEYFLSKRSHFLNSRGVSEVARRTMLRAYEYAESLVDGQIQVQVTGTRLSSGPAITQLKVRLFEPVVRTAPELVAKYDLWIGEAGLECSRFNKIGGVPCDPDQWRFNDSGSWTMNPDGTATLTVDGSRAPAAAYTDVADPYIGTNERLYVTESLATGQRTAVFGFSPAIFRIGDSPTTSKWWRNFPSLGPAMREALMSTLAPDPEKPSKGQISCTGLDGTLGLGTDRVKLEDELIPVTQDDSIDTSFRYYLEEARKAADIADGLGEQVYQQGLVMDQRAEDAAAELEQLCGGAINVAKLQQVAQAIDANKTISDLLKLPPEKIPAEYLSDVEGARDCLGGNVDTAPVNVAVGDQTLCTWRYKTPAGVLPYLPCQLCPDDAKCPSECVVIAKDEASCVAQWRDYSAVEAVFVANKMGLTVTEADEPPANSSIAAWLLGRHLMWRDSRLPADIQAMFPNSRAFARFKNFFESITQWQTWATQENIRNLAQALGLRESYDDGHVVTLGDSAWLDLPSLYAEYDGWVLKDKNPVEKMAWPCGRLPELASECAQDGGGSLICGDLCAPSQRLMTSARLSLAVGLLKTLTGAGVSNIYERAPLFQYSLSEILSNTDGTFAYAGATPHPRDSSRTVPYYSGIWTERDTKKSYPVRCYDNELLSDSFLTTAYGVKINDGKVCTSIQQSDKQQFYLARPSALWTNTNCLNVPGLYQDKGCGALPTFFAGHTSNLILSPLSAGLPQCVQFVYGNTYNMCFPSTQQAQEYADLLGTKGVTQRYLTPRKPYTEVSGEAVIDAFSLAYHVFRIGAGGCDTMWKQAPAIRSVADFAEVKKMLMCSADSVERMLTRMWLPAVPKDIFEDLKIGQASGTFPKHRGDYGVTLAELLSTSQNLTRQSDTVVQAIRDLGSVFEFGATKLHGLDIDKDIADVEDYIQKLTARNSMNAHAIEDLRSHIQSIRTEQAIDSLDLQCAVATFNAIPSVSTGFPAMVSTTVSPGAAYAAVGTCMSTKRQKQLENDIASLNDKIDARNDDTYANEQAIIGAAQDKIRLGKQITDNEKKLVLLDMSDKATEKADTLNEAATTLNETYASIHALLTKLDQQRNRARRAASKVLLLDNDDMGRVFNVNSAMRARMNTLLVRYTRARERAIQAAYRARRAIEQKVGVDLEDIEEDVGVLKAPGGKEGWAKTLCALPALNYRDIRNPAAQDNNSSANTANVPGLNSDWSVNGYNFANAYVGDYVTLLENFIEAYRTEYPSDDGESTMVVSLRDELLNVRESCEVQGPNILTGSQSMVGNGWEVDGSSDWTLSTTPASNENAYSCDVFGVDTLANPKPDQAQTCRALGGAGAVELRYAKRVSPSVGSSAGNVTTPASLPTVGLASRYIAAECIETAPGSGVIASCPNKAPASSAAPPGEDRMARTYVHANTNGVSRLIANGIGGKPTIELNNAYLVSPVHATASSAYTLAFVYRAPAGADVSYMSRAQPSGNRTNFVGGAIRTGFGADAPYTFFDWCRNATSAGCYNNQAGPAARPLFHAIQAPPGLPQRGTIFTLVASDAVAGSAGFVKAYVDGHLVYASNVAPPAVQLGGAVFSAQPGTSAAQMAEHLTYSRALSHEEVLGLHAFLAAAYQGNLNEPVNWLDVDDMQLMRDGNQSPVSGHVPLYTNTNLVATPSLVFDRARGAGYTQYGVAAGQPTSLTSFSGGTTPHYGLNFNNSSVYIGSAYTVVGATGFSSGDPLYYNSAHSKDFVVSFVAKVNDVAADHGLWGADLVDQSDSTIRVPSIVIAAGGRPQLLLTSPTTGMTTLAASTNSIASGVPFVLSLRGSASSNTVDLFVNGQKVVTAAGTANLGPRILGRTGRGGATPGLYLRGAVAQHMLHLRAMSDAELIALHRSLGQSFGIETPAVGGTTPSGTLDRPQLRQTVEVTAGDYWLSWHEKRPCSQNSGLEVRVARGKGALQAQTVPRSQCVESARLRQTVVNPDTNRTFESDKWLTEGWSRRFVFVNVPQSGPVSVAFRLPSAPANTNDMTQQPSALLAGAQLERIEMLQSEAPTNFFPTDDDLRSLSSDCEDTDGSTFRAMRWEHNCEYYCPSATGQGCTDILDKSTLPQRCYYELPFIISQDDIEAGKLIQNGGFAAGNFNYRHDKLAVNFVGTGIKNCAQSNLPSSCYGNNFVQFTLHHDEPFRVRNYDGDVYYAPLFPGRIQMGNGLAAERYLTNPLSSADRGLLTDYWRTEFRGRPLEGAYTLRIYDSPDIDWSKLEDVQLLVGYRYWTRLR